MSALCRQLNLDVLGGDVDVKVDAEPLGKPHQRLHAWVVIAGFQPGYGRLLHLQFPGSALCERPFSARYSTRRRATARAKAVRFHARRNFGSRSRFLSESLAVVMRAGVMLILRILKFSKALSASRTARLKPLGLTMASGPIEPTKKFSAPVRR